MKFSQVCKHAEYYCFGSGQPIFQRKRLLMLSDDSRHLFNNTNVCCWYNCIFITAYSVYRSYSFFILAVGLRFNNRFSLER